MKNKSAIFLFSILYSLFFFSSASAEGDASLYLSPSTGSYAIDEVFVVAVNINTNGKTINTAEGKISFNKDELDVISVSKEGSILTSWPSEPEFSNEEGLVSFGGSTEKEGYIGVDGKILSIVFKALQSKASTVKFAMGAAIAATDGLGTNILTSLNAGQYELSPKEVIPSLESTTASTTTETLVASSTPFALTSLTHPEQTAWYATTTAELSWTLKEDVISVSFLFDQKPTSTPKSVFSPPVFKKTIKKIPEGVSYFHFQKNIGDEWSDTIHYRIAVDMTPPDHFAISQANTEKYGFNFAATDKVSGIAKYIIHIDSGSTEEWRDDGSHVYIPSGLISGDHTLYAKALDFAGNSLERSFPFTVIPVASPTIAAVPDADISIGSPLVLSYKANPDAQVRVFVSKNGADPRAEDAVKGSDGIFMFTLKDPVEEGTYSVWAISIMKGVESQPTEKITITGNSDIIVFGKKALNILGSIYSKIFFALLAVLLLFYGWYRFRGHSETEVGEAPHPSVAINHEEKKHVPVVEEQTPQENSFQVRIQKRS